MAALEKGNESNAMAKHQKEAHQGMQWDFSMKVLKSHKYPLGRQSWEGRLVEDFKGDLVLNQKGEWGCNLPPKLVIEGTLEPGQDAKRSRPIEAKDTRSTHNEEIEPPPPKRKRGKVPQILRDETEPKLDPERVENDVVDVESIESVDQDEDQGASLAPESIVEPIEQRAEIAQTEGNQTMTSDEVLPILTVVEDLNDLGTSRPPDEIEKTDQRAEIAQNSRSISENNQEDQDATPKQLKMQDFFCPLADSVGPRNHPAGAGNNFEGQKVCDIRKESDKLSQISVFSILGSNMVKRNGHKTSGVKTQGMAKIIISCRG